MAEALKTDQPMLGFQDKVMFGASLFLVHFKSGRESFRSMGIRASNSGGDYGEVCFRWLSEETDQTVRSL